MRLFFVKLFDFIKNEAEKEEDFGHFKLLKNLLLKLMTDEASLSDKERKTLTSQLTALTNPNFGSDNKIQFQLNIPHLVGAINDGKFKDTINDDITAFILQKHSIKNIENPAKTPAETLSAALPSTTISMKTGGRINSEEIFNAILRKDQLLTSLEAEFKELETYFEKNEFSKATQQIKYLCPIYKNNEDSPDIKDYIQKYFLYLAAKINDIGSNTYRENNFDNALRALQIAIYLYEWLSENTPKDPSNDETLSRIYYDQSRCYFNLDNIPDSNESFVKSYLMLAKSDIEMTTKVSLLNDLMYDFHRTLSDKFYEDDVSTNKKLSILDQIEALIQFYPSLTEIYNEEHHRILILDKLTKMTDVYPELVKVKDIEGANALFITIKKTMDDNENCLNKIEDEDKRNELNEIKNKIETIDRLSAELSMLSDKNADMR